MKKERKKENIKEKTFTLRIDQDTIDIMNSFSQLYGISKSAMARKSIRSYAMLNIENKDAPNPKLLFSRNMQKVLLDYASESKIEELAEVSYRNGIADLTFILGKIEKEVDVQEQTALDPMKPINLIFKENFVPIELEPNIRKKIADALLSSLTQNIFTSDGQNWFNEIFYFWKGKNVVITGKHQLGENFSLFIKIILRKYLERCGYSLLREDYAKINKKIRINGKDENDTVDYDITLVFKPNNK